ncbi:PREDICTED: uncharacterized protein LOC105117606 [Populus euphratica]|uniref:Uncharacterized protein LOC105117606 n=1 Tax=Populus euphratica TaxID=75702 RepID=A0AAJ6XCP6_POPEU|nr:PREDICTED: uncharacterized protein LOC105117606 [Populus euphratica]
MSEISESQIPFPRKKGIRFMILYSANWQDAKENVAKHVDWTRKVYKYMQPYVSKHMQPYVSKHPRETCVNYRDLDLGINKRTNTSFTEAGTSRGLKCFKNNFHRLAFVKAKVDPDNFFWYEQSIPPLPFQLQEKLPTVAFTPYGGKMSEISESQIPFPHRKGIRFMILYSANWQDAKENVAKHVDWTRKVYKYMQPYVSKHMQPYVSKHMQPYVSKHMQPYVSKHMQPYVSKHMQPYVSKHPRETCVNYRDLDLGINKRTNTSFTEAGTSRGLKCFKNNFHRLAFVKAKVDPDNFFWYEQSIPPLPFHMR